MKDNPAYTKIVKLTEDIKKEITNGDFATDELSDIMDKLSWLVELTSNKDSED